MVSQQQFPYSRHSSYSELCHLIQAFKPRDIIPCTVDAETWCEDMSIKSLFGRLCAGTDFPHDYDMRKVVEERQEEKRLRKKRKRETSTSSDPDRESLGQESSDIAARDFTGLLSIDAESFSRNEQEIRDIVASSKNLADLAQRNSATVDATAGRFDADGPLGAMESSKARLRIVRNVMSTKQMPERVHEEPESAPDRHLRDQNLAAPESRARLEYQAAEEFIDGCDDLWLERVPDRRLARRLKRYFGGEHFLQFRVILRAHPGISNGDALQLFSQENNPDEDRFRYDPPETDYQDPRYRLIERLDEILPTAGSTICESILEQANWDFAKARLALADYECERLAAIKLNRFGEHLSESENSQERWERECRSQFSSADSLSDSQLQDSPEEASYGKVDNRKEAYKAVKRLDSGEWSDHAPVSSGNNHTEMEVEL